MDIGGGARRQEHGRTADVAGVAPAAGGDALLDLAVARLVGLQRGGVVGGDIARRDGVHIDAPGRPFVCEQLGEAGDAALRRGVARHADAALEGEERGDVDDLARALGQHVATGRLAEEEGGLEVGVDHRVPILLGKVDAVGAADDAGIIDEDVEAAELLQRLVDHALHRFDGGEVGGDDLRLAAERADLLHRFLGGRAADGGDVGAGGGERQRDRLADAGIGAGDDRGLAGKIKGGGHAGRAFLIGMLGQSYSAAGAKVTYIPVMWNEVLPCGG